MEEIYRGVPYIRSIRYKDSTEFANNPNVILFNVRTKKYFVATVETAADNKSVVFTFSKEQTDAMTPGVYRLEIYEDDTNSVLITYRDTYAKVMTVAVSHDQESGDPVTI